MVVSESSFGAYVCHRRPVGLHHNERSCCFTILHIFAKLGERPTILDSHSDVLKDFIDQKRDDKDVLRV